MRRPRRWWWVLLIAVVLVAAALIARAAPGPTGDSDVTAEASPSADAGRGTASPPPETEDPDGGGGDRASVPRASGSWSFIAQAPIDARLGAAVAVAGERLFVWGGIPPSFYDGRRDVAWPTNGAVYDGAADRWRPVADGLSPRAGAGTAWARDRVFVVGGLQLGDDGEAVPLDDGGVWTPGRGWSALPASPLRPRYLPFVAFTGRELVVWGGLGFAEDGEGRGREQRVLHDGAVYDPERGEWRMIPDPPIRLRDPDLEISGPSAALSDELVLVTAGRAAAYDVVGDRWRELPPPRPAPASESLLPDLDAHVVGNQLVLGGTYPSADGEVSFGSVLDLLYQRWTTIPPAPFELQDTTSTVVGRSVVFVSSSGRGAGGRAPARWRVDERRWEVLEAPPRPGTVGAVVAGLDESLVVWGGIPAGRGAETMDMAALPGVRWTPEEERDGAG